MQSTRSFCLISAFLCAAVVALDRNGHPDLADRIGCSGAISERLQKTRVNTTARLAELRRLMANPVDNSYPSLAAYIVPMDDEHLSEYISPHDQLVRHISGFSGSAGVAIVTSDAAALWTDGRYFVQAEQQLDCNWILMKSQAGAAERHEWLQSQLKSSQHVGADGRTMSALDWLDLQRQLTESGISMISVRPNLVDLMWTRDRPAATSSAIFVHQLQYAGKKWTDKIADVRMVMQDASENKTTVKALLVSQLDEVAWLLNLRGSDMPHTPEFKGYVVVELDSVQLFVNMSQVDDEVRAHLSTDQCSTSADSDCVTLHAYSDISQLVADRAASQWTGGKVWVPSRWSYAGGASYDLYSKVPSDQLFFRPSPLIRMKAMKNAVEVQAMLRAHLRDSVALCDFLAHLEQAVTRGEHWTELSVTRVLRHYRARQALFKDTSFGTIAAFGPHAAIIHYKASEKTDAVVDTSSMLLLDSGGQYLDGTTDVTRTMHYGTPEQFERQAYTRVLMGVIDLARVVFKAGTTDSRLDILARQHLFRVGLDYLHGTGHGIGQFLQVHEAPTQLRVYQKEEHKMEEGMFFSNEPGYYETDRFGVRLETIMYVAKASNLKYNFSGPYFKLEPATLVPFEAKLIEKSLLSHDQLEWLNGYHQLVRERVGPMMTEQGLTDGLAWLQQKTQPISQHHHHERKDTSGGTSYTLWLHIIIFGLTLSLMSCV